jgi:rhomboid protease GluP
MSWHRIRYPATATTLVVTTILTAASLVHPAILFALQRMPSARTGEWWRLVTPLLFERGGPIEIGFNLVTVALAGVLAERVFGSRWWFVFYLVGGIVGETAGLAWKPIGAGTSVAVGGLLGAWRFMLCGDVDSASARWPAF